MLAALALLAALAQDPVLPPDSVLTVRPLRGPARPVPILVDGGRRYVRLDQLAAALGGQAPEERDGRWRLRVAGAVLQLRDGIPFVGVGEGREARELALADAPFVAGERLWVPLQLAADLLPQALAGARFDTTRTALTVGRPAPAVAAAPADSAVRLPTIRGRRLTPAAPPATEQSAPAAPRPAQRTVVVDAGHGGPDTGMSGPLGGGRPVQEKDVTLAVSRALAGTLRERGLGVVMTRTTDTLIALADRGRIANQRKGDLFISIHVNAANPRWRDPAGTRGFETYFLSEAKTEDDRRVAEMENESVRFETSASVAKDDPLNFIIHDMAQNEHLRESNQLATLVQRRLGQVHPGPSRGVRQAGFRVLVSAFMPAILVEIGFGTNPQEAAFIASPRGQQAIADAIADAAIEYLRRYESRVRTGAGK